MDNEKELEIDILHLLQVLWRNILSIILAGLICGAVVFGATRAFVRPLYDSRVYMYVNSTNVSLGGAKVSISTAELNAAKSLVDTYIVILKTRLTLMEVIETAGVDYTFEELRDMISADSVNGTEIFYVNVTSTDPAEAELLANTIAEVLPYKIAGIVDGSSVRIVDYAVQARERSSPNYFGNAQIGALAGMFLVSALLILLDLLDEQIHSTDYLTKEYPDIPVLSAIPDLLARNSGSNSYYNYYYQEPGSRPEQR